MQSLDYHGIDKVLTYDSEIPVYFILPIEAAHENGDRFQRLIRRITG